MGYSKNDFKKLRGKFHASLFEGNGEPLSCRLHDHGGATGRMSLVSDEAEEIASHVAEACNIADVISSIDRLLSLPRSEVACAELSETFLLRLDVLREYIASSFKTSQNKEYHETEADLVIRRWAGFLKHPSEFVFAHRCLSEWGVELDEPPIAIDTKFLASWDSLKAKEKDKRKSDLAHEIVTVELPSIDEIVPFFASSAAHLNCLLAK